MLPPIEILRANYFIRGVDRAFAAGRRETLLYAVPCALGGFSKLNASGPDPADYLEFAKGDLRTESEHAPSNAVGNAKRAVHLAIDGVLRLHGLEEAYGRRNFPQKLAVLDLIGAVPTRLIASLNERRNLLEHEFQLSTREEAESLVETAELFLAVVYAFLRKAVLGVYASRTDDTRCFEYLVNPLDSVVTEAEVDAELIVQTQHGTIHVNIEKDTPRRLLRTIRLQHGTQAEWLPYLDVFVYCTRRSAFHLFGSGPPGYLALGRTHVNYPETSGLPITRRAG